MDFKNISICINTNQALEFRERGLIDYNGFSCCLDWRIPNEFVFKSYHSLYGIFGINQLKYYVVVFTVIRGKISFR